MAEYPQPGGQQRSQQKFIVFDRFEKMNTQAVRTGLPDNQLAWLENLQPLSENKLQVVPAAAAAAFASIPETINLGFYAFLNGHDYAILFTTAGSAWYIDFTANTVGVIAPDGTFSLAPDCTTYQGSVLLINDIQAGYSVWNTFCYVRAGGVSPNLVITDGGSGFGSPPAFIVFNLTQGANVPGANGVGVLTNGVVTQWLLLNGGSGVNSGDSLELTYPPSGSGATFSVTMTTSNVQTTNINNSGFWTAGNGPGPGTYNLLVSSGAATVTATVSAVSGGFAVTAVTTTAHGSGYTAAPTITWNSAVNPITGGGTVPTFSPNMANIAVATVAVGAGGTGYAPSSTLGLVFTHAGGPGPVATGTCHTSAGGVVTTAALTTGGTYLFGTVPKVFINTGFITPTSDTQVQPWPTVPAGTTIAVFQGRVWLGGGQLLQFTGTGANAGAPASGVPGPGYDDFQAIDAAGTLQIVDADLVHAITALRSLNNYLWIVGDQSVKQIGNLSISTASPPVTLFTILTLSSDQGTVWPQSCISYNRIFLFANPLGIFGVFGSTVQKVSDDLDGIFQAANFSLQPQGAVLDLNSKHNAVFLLRYNDPVAGLRSLLVLFDGKKWWLANQGTSIATVLTFPQPNPNINTLWGTLAGSDLTQLFAQPGVAVPFKMQTALSHGGNPVQGKRVVRAGFTADAGSIGTVNVEMDGDTSTSSNTLGVTATSLLTGGSNDASNVPINMAGVYLGVTLTGTMANLVIQNVILEYQETALWKVAIAPPPPSQAPISSAGVFNSTGALVRTLWSAVTNNPNVSNPAAAWDGALDNGTVAPTGTYTVKLLQNDVQYNWDGVAGNTSPDHTTLFYHSWFYPIQGMAITAAGEIYFIVGYSERQPTLQVTTTADPQNARPCAPSTFRTAYGASLFVCTDGTLTYFAIEGGATESFVCACSTVDGAESFLCKKSPHTFPSGSGAVIFGVFTTTTLLDVSVSNFASQITGMAVQQGASSYLFISRGFQNQVLTGNKTSGATLQTNTTIVNPAGMATNPIDGSLWLIHDVPSGATTTLNPSHKGSGVALSGGNLVATFGTGSQLVTAIGAWVTGKFYCEFTWTTAANVDGAAIGIASVDPIIGESVNVPPGLNTTTLLNPNGGGSAGLYRGDPNVFIRGGTQSVGLTAIQGDVFGMAVDIDKQLLWFRQNGGNWNNNALANPVTGVGGVDFSFNLGQQILGPIVPCVGTNVAQTGGVITCNFGATAYGTAAPSGFGNWHLPTATNVEKYTADGSGNLSSTGTVITGLSAPVALAVSPDGSTLLVADAGTSHQVKAFNTSTGAAKTAFATSGVFGTPGGYVNSPAVTFTKFCFRVVNDLGANPAAPTFIAYAPDGSWWLGDVANYRSLHFSAGNSPAYIEQIAYMPVFYPIRNVRNDVPGRLLADWLEFSVDYTKPIAPNNGSWALVNNWVGNISPYQYEAVFNPYSNMEHALKASNGRTYAGKASGNATLRWYELDPTNGLRDTGVIIFQSWYVDGNFNQWQTPALTSGSSSNILENPFTGFDGSNNPTWRDGAQGAGSTVYTTQVMPPNSTTPGNAGPAVAFSHTELTSSGIIPIFNPNSEFTTFDTNYHLIGIEPISGNVKFLTHQACPSNHGGGFAGVGNAPRGNLTSLTYPEAPYFPVGNGVGANGGGALLYIAGDSNVFTGYPGEVWANNQTNIWSHWHESGLLVNRFGAGTFGTYITANGAYNGPTPLTFQNPDDLTPDGQPRIAGFPFSWKGLAGMAGNAAQGALVLVNGVYYIHHNDEWYHGGIHRWSVENTSSIQITSQTVSWISSSYIPPNDPTNLLQGLPLNNTLINGTAGWFRNPVDDTALNPTTGPFFFTSAINCSVFNPDIAMSSFVGGMTETLYKDFPVGGSGNWTLSGIMSQIPGIVGPLPTAVTDVIYLDILDNTGKVILRSYIGEGADTVNRWFVNDIVVKTLSPNDFNFQVEQPLPFSIVGSVGSSVVNLTWGSWTASATGVYQAGAAFASPSRLLLTHIDNGVGAGIAFSKLNWVRKP